jgi:CheY-like chemotaxis protein
MPRSPGRSWRIEALFTVETAANGHQGAGNVSSKTRPDYYDAILMDMRMPLMDGLQASGQYPALGQDLTQSYCAHRWP